MKYAASLLLVLQHLSALDQFSVQKSISKSEISALHSIFKQTNGNSWIWKDTTLLKWNFSSDSINPCLWQGIACEYGHVIKSALSSYGLTGILPLEI